MWSHQIKEHKIVQLTLTKPSPYGEEDPYKYHIFYQSWAFGACSTATLWGWKNIPVRHCTEETLAEFVRYLLDKVRPAVSSWDPHRVFAMLPLAGLVKSGGENTEPPFFTLFHNTIYRGQEPVYVYQNRSHDSTDQRLFDFDTDKALTWLEKYDAEKKLEQAAALHTDGTIIVQPGASNVAAAVQYFVDAGQR